MIRFRRLIGLGVLVALAGSLGGCGGGLGNFDPTSVFDILDTKKPLPGERRPVFPEGVPGVDQGIPPDMVKGNQQQPQTQAAVPPPVEERPPPKAAPPPKSASKPVRRRTTAIPSDDAEPAAAPAPAPTERQPAPMNPAPSAQQSQPSPFPSPFPAPMPSGTFQR